MTTSVGIVGSSVGAVTPQTPVAPVATAASGNFTTALSSIPSPAAVGALHSPRIVQDPSVGFITEYLSANGSEVVSQTPSAVTVAYLRIGLTAEGLPKASSHLSVATTA